VSSNQRWQAAADALGITMPLSAPELRAALAQAAQASGYEEQRINLILTPGDHRGGVFGAGPATWVAIVRELHEFPATNYLNGISAVTFRGERVCPEIKTTAYITGRDGLRAAEAAHAAEALYCAKDGELSEGVTSNLLLLINDTIIQPSAPTLPGITQDLLRHVAQEQCLSWSRRRVVIDDLWQADEVWLSSTVRELMPVVQVDGRAIANGKPGPWAERLRSHYRHQAIADAAADIHD
jgi:branched-chain amino acid aminotransferase